MTEPRLSDLPPTATPRLSLRVLGVGDAGGFRAMTDEPAITDVVDGLETPFTLVAAERLIAGGGDGRDAFRGVRLSGSPALVGAVGTHLVGDGEIEVGYWLASACRGQGYASEALAGVLAALASAYPSRRVFAECRPTNMASWRLLIKAGFAPDGAAGHRAGRLRLILRRQADARRPAAYSGP